MGKICGKKKESGKEVIRDKKPKRTRQCEVAPLGAGAKARMVAPFTHG